MNKIILLGNLTKDPEQRQTQNADLTVCGFSLAVRRRKTREGEPDADFFNFSAFGKTAEVILKYCKKGSKLLVSGRVHNHSYKNSSGDVVHGYGFIAEEIEFAGSAQQTQQQAQAPAAVKPPARQAPAQQQEDFTPYYDDLHFI